MVQMTEQSGKSSNAFKANADSEDEAMEERLGVRTKKRRLFVVIFY